jgi:hypothetical protein
MEVNRGTLTLLHARMEEGLRCFSEALAQFADELDAGADPHVVAVMLRQFSAELDRVTR